MPKGEPQAQEGGASAQKLYIRVTRRTHFSAGEEKMIKYVRALKVRKACLNVVHLSSQDA
jgi:hypothetical protein